jgi:hypothetical protein
VSAQETIRRFYELNAEYEAAAAPLRKEVQNLVAEFVKNGIPPDEWISVLLSQVITAIEVYLVPAGALAGAMIGSGCAIIQGGGRRLADAMTIVKEVWALLENARPN